MTVRRVKGRRGIRGYTVYFRKTNMWCIFVRVSWKEEDFSVYSYPKFIKYIKGKVIYKRKKRRQQTSITDSVMFFNSLLSKFSLRWYTNHDCIRDHYVLFFFFHSSRELEYDECKIFKSSFCYLFTLSIKFVNMGVCVLLLNFKINLTSHFRNDSSTITSFTSFVYSIVWKLCRYLSFITRLLLSYTFSGFHTRDDRRIFLPATFIFPYSVLFSFTETLSCPRYNPR